MLKRTNLILASYFLDYESARLLDIYVKVVRLGGMVNFVQYKVL